MEHTANRIETFDHAAEADTLAPGIIDVEPDAGIDDGQVQSIGFIAQVYRHVLGVAVLDRVLQRFLNDPEQTQHDITWQRRWYVPVCVDDGDPGAGQIEAQAFDRKRQADHPQPGWV